MTYQVTTKDPDHIAIKISVKDRLFFFFCPLGFILAGWTMIAFNDWFITFHHEIYIVIVGWIAILFFGGGFLIFLVSGILFKPLTQADATGITLRKLYRRTKRLAWCDIDLIDMEDRILVVFLHGGNFTIETKGAHLSNRKIFNLLVAIKKRSKELS